jgi:hypothetical protein
MLSMKKLLCTLCVSGLIATISPAGAAEDNGFYAGIGTGRLDFDFTGADLQTDASPVRGSRLNVDVNGKTPLRISGGYNWGGWAFEVAYEHMLGSADMELQGARVLDFDYSNFTLGGVYRGSGNVYLLGKFGLSLPNTDSNTAGTFVEMDNSAYLGAGVGYRFTPTISLEFDYTQTNRDTGTYMLGLRKHF